MDEKKKRKTEDLLINLEEMVDRFKARLKQGKNVHSNDIIQSVDRLLVPYSRDVEFHELKGDWSPLQNVKWSRIKSTEMWNMTSCDELYAIIFEAPVVGTVRMQIRHHFTSFDNGRIIQYVAIEKDPEARLCWHRLSPTSVAGTAKKHLLPVIFEIISKNCAYKESLNLHKLKNEIAACTFD